MITEFDKVKRFEDVVEKTVSKSVRKLRDEAEAYINGEMQNLEAELNQKLQARLKFESERILSESNKKLSLAENEAKKAISKKRSQVIDLVFEAVESNVRAFAESDAYAAFLEKSLKALSSQLDGEMIVFCRENDVELLKKLCPETEICAVNDITFGGIYASDIDKSMFVYDTFDSRIESCRENFLAFADLSV